RRLVLILTVGLAVVLFLTSATSHPAGAQTTGSGQAAGAQTNGPQPAVALTGQVTSAADGPIEGVLVSARKAGSTVTITVVTADGGRYRFRRAKLDPGKYALAIRAAGYDLDGPGAVEITAAKTASVDLTLRQARDLAAQLTNAEWIVSAPGTPQQKDS